MPKILPASQFESGEPGLYAGVDEIRYHAFDACSNSRLTKLMRSPAHCRHAIDHPGDDTPARKLGRAIHSCILEPDLFETHYAVWCGGPRRSNQAKEAYAAMCAEHGEAFVLTEDHYDTCLQVQEAVANHAAASELLCREGHSELSGLYVHEETGLLCKFRIDRYVDDGDIIVDVKSTRDASPAAFVRDAYNFGYQRQGGGYMKAAEQLGLSPRAFIVIAVEKDGPLGVAAYKYTDDALKAGLDQLQPLYEQYHECESSGVWPGYDDGLQDLSLPAYAWNQIYAEYEELP